MTFIKICGIKTLRDALGAVDAGADFLGFNFYQKGLRYIDPASCAQITSVVRRQHPQIKLVGVFVNSSEVDIRSVLEGCNLDLAQLHGDESLETFHALAPRAYKAFRGVPEHVNGFARGDAPALLIDAAVKDFYGGTGVHADWSKAAELAKQVPLLLAGGLNSDNVASAIEQVQPWGVDVASGVESAPGEKDTHKMSAFVRAVRQVQLERGR